MSDKTNKINGVFSGEKFLVIPATEIALVISGANTIKEAQFPYKFEPEKTYRIFYTPIRNKSLAKKIGTLDNTEEYSVSIHEVPDYGFFRNSEEK